MLRQIVACQLETSWRTMAGRRCPITQLRLGRTNGASRPRRWQATELMWLTAPRLPPPIWPPMWHCRGFCGFAMAWLPERRASFWEWHTAFVSISLFSGRSPCLRPFSPAMFLLGRLRTVPVRFPQETLGAVFCLDTLCLTAMLGLTGGPMNPFSLLYLVQITLSAVVLRKVWTWALGALSTVCFGLLFFHVPSAAFQTHHSEHGLSPHLVGMWIAFVIAAALITFFTGKIAGCAANPRAARFSLCRIRSPRTRDWLLW